ncbi:split zinc finger protein [Suhomyces tanzawaensis NRRL Y-17324]|uniref:Split zinc finger protein n=1 Tax=Suhomyces tanzawaensis NRRL Y-17324 TaxID=984487 RepID=A0A1E4SGQ2_9ASCO|nr:split zinc finger protein [Suhomyces tanzawaensis NRRL Y-17324]ODV78592.1 split zinc finger protein [Suhomyces tanzawaensis NRRL Y-17324]
MFNTKIFENSNPSPSNTPAINIPNASSEAPGALGDASTASNPQPIDITYQRHQLIFNNGRFRRESIAHSQGMGGVSWGSVTIGSWLKDEVMMSSNYNSYAQHPTGTTSNNLSVHNGNLINPRRGSFRHQTQSISMSPPLQTSYLPNLEADYCKDYSCCGELLPTLHDLLRHYEEAHISPSPPADNSHMLSTRNNNFNNMHNIMETVSTTDHHSQPHATQPNNLNLHNSHYNIQQQTINQASPIPANAPIPSSQTQFNPSQMHAPSQAPSQLQQNPQVNSPRANTPMQTDEEDAMYIDDPARHLYVMENDEHKPFKCPVIGCEKTYKNQNGLKYHRLHGHQGQTLKENPDGTISIIDPESNTPYLDGAGMEKDKPYRCEVCGKRYKNLNGLKYHRGHTTH